MLLLLISVLKEYSNISFVALCMHMCLYVHVCRCVLPNYGNEWKYSFMGNIS